MAEIPGVDAPANTRALQPTAKQAVVVIHGMGEQIPMDTIKSFVKAVWETDSDIIEKKTSDGEDFPYPEQVWSKPDARTGSLELRRITTRASIPSPQFPGGVRTDFYELYWADLTGGTPWTVFIAWLSGLLFRPWRRVPKDVRPAWVVLQLATVVTVAAVVVLPLVPDRVLGYLGPWAVDWKWLFVPLAGALGAAIQVFAIATFGRVVRYTRAEPDNIAAREAVRARGLKLFEALHEGSAYKRIIVVAHSLGSILALDLISYFWARREAARTIREGDTSEFEALCEVERAAADIHRHSLQSAKLTAYYAAQRKLRVALAARPAPAVNTVDTRWLISDFITLGSPLTHAEFLLAKDGDDLRNRIVAREIVESPPFREALDPGSVKRALATKKLPVADGKENCLLSFPHATSADIWQMHHGAPFAVVRWTNIYDPSSSVFWGDVIGGPLKDSLGPAIIDVDLSKLREPPARWFTHTKYWAFDKEKTIADATGSGTSSEGKTVSGRQNVHIGALRAAINLLDRENVQADQRNTWAS